MKKVLKITGIVVLALVIGFAGLVAYVYYDKPDDIAEYSVQGMQQWLMDMIDEGSKTETRYFYGDDAAVEMMDGNIDAYLDELIENSPRYCYDVSEVSYLVTRELSYITATIWVEYNDFPVRYKDLKVMETPLQAVNYVLEEYESGNLSVYFLCGDEWTEDDIISVSMSAGMNIVKTSALYKEYYYLLEEGRLDEYQLAFVEIDYGVGAYTLTIRDQELTQELDAAEASIRDLGLTADKEVYNAIGKVIAEKAEYDDELLEATLAENRDEEGWVNSGAYGALVSGQTICTGYAMAYKALCDRFGLPCWIVVGEVEDEGHAWNMIQLDGETFYVDCTFFDGSDGYFPLIFSADKLEEYQYVDDEYQIYLWEDAA